MSANAAMRMWLVRGEADIEAALENAKLDEAGCAPLYGRPRSGGDEPSC